MHSVLNVKVLEGAFNQEKALVGAFSVIVKTNATFAALICTEQWQYYIIMSYQTVLNLRMKLKQPPSMGSEQK